MYFLEGLQYDPVQRIACVSGKTAHLSTMEGALFTIFIENPNTVFSREALIHYLWGSSLNYKTRVIDVYISQLRKKLNLQNILKTVYRKGYIFILQ